MNEFNRDLANQLLFADPETGEELRLKYEPQNYNGALVLYVTNRDGTRNWKHTIKTEEL